MSELYYDAEAATLEIAANFGAVLLQCTGTAWLVVGVV